MKKILSYAIVGLTLTTVMAACTSKSPNGRTDTVTSGVVSFASDESFKPLIEEEQEVFESQHPQATLKPVWTNESDAMNMLLKGKIYLIFTARNFKAEELENLRTRNFRPQVFPIAYDALAIITNKETTDSLISVDDLKRIFTGQATKWSQIYKGSKRGDISVVFDNGKSSAVHFVEDSVLGGKPITSPNVAAVKTSAEVIKYVEDNKNAIGIIGNNWLNDKRDTTNLTFKRNIRVMLVSRVSPATLASSWGPYQGYIYNDNYPLIRTIYALVNDPHQGLPLGFAHFVQSPIGQRIVLKTGLLPMYGNLNIRDVKVGE